MDLPGLFRGSRDARSVALTFCWVAFVGIPVNIVAFIRDEPVEILGAGLAELGVLYLIYRVLTSPSIREGFFRLPKIQLQNIRSAKPPSNHQA
jgi:hypothetical protein